MISVNAYTMAAFLGVSVALDWLTVEGIEHQVASYLRDRGATVDSDLPVEDCYLHRHFSMPLFVERGEEDPLGALVTRVIGVDIWNTELEDNDLLLLRHLPNLSFVWIDDPDITGLGITHLRHCYSLVQLGIDNTNVDSWDLAFLRNLPRLKWLTFHVPHDETRASVEINGLKQLTQLKGLTIHGLPITESTWKSLKELRHLHELDLVNCWGRDVKVKLDFSVWTGLKSLTLSSLPLSPEEWKSVFSNEELISLRVEYMVLFTPQFREIRRLKNLRGLHFKNVRFASNMQFDLSELSKLEYVTFSHCMEVDSHLPDLEELPDLRQLVLNETLVSEPTIKGLSLGDRFELLILHNSLSEASEAHFRSNHPQAEVVRDVGYVLLPVLPVPRTENEEECLIRKGLYRLISSFGNSTIVSPFFGNRRIASPRDGDSARGSSDGESGRTSLLRD